MDANEAYEKLADGAALITIAQRAIKPVAQNYSQKSAYSNILKEILVKLGECEMLLGLVNDEFSDY